MDLVFVLKGVAPPALVALALVSAGGNRLWPLALALGLGFAFVLLQGWPKLPHELWSRPDSTQWLLWGIVGVAITASLEHWRCLPRGSGTAFVAVAAAFVVWLLLGKLGARESTSWVVMHIGGGGAAVALVTLAGARLASRAASSPFLPALAMLILSADAALLLVAGSAKYGQLCGACAATLGAALCTAFWRRPFTMASHDGALFGAVHGLFLLAGIHFSYESTWTATVLAASAPLLPLALPRSFARERPKRWLLTATVLAALPLAGAITLCL